MTASSAEALDQGWARQLPVWHAMFASLMAVVVLVAIVEGGQSLGYVLTAHAGLAVSYLVWGRRGLGAEGSREAWTYVVFAWLMFLVAVAVDPFGEPWILTFALFPQTWAMLGRSGAPAMVTIGVAGFTALRLHQGVNGPRGVLIGSFIMLLTSLVLGLFIHWVIDQASSRALALDELTRTRDALAVAERSAGVVEERERLSREIHDTLAQGFTSVLTLTRATESALERGDLDTVRDRLAVIESTAADNLAEARLIVAEMTPGHLQSRSLAEALERLVDEVEAGSGLSGTLRIYGDPVVLPVGCEVVLLRTTQEALANVRRHAGATTFAVHLVYAAAGPVALTVTDDGVGFDPGAARRGYGLDGAAVRAQQVGGTFTVESAPGGGSRLRVEVPQ